MKNDFLDNALHKLKSPLTVIKEGIDIISDGTSGEISTEQREILATVSVNVDRLHKMVEDIFTFLMITDKSYECVKHKISIAFLVNTALAQCNDTAGKHGVKIELTTNYDHTIYVSGNKDLLVMLFRKIILNAIQNPKTTRIQINIASFNSYVKIALIDNGGGLSEDELSDIMSPFTRLLSTNTILEGGAGLGLSICKQIVDLHNGSLSITNSSSDVRGIECTIIFSDYRE